MKRLLSLLLVTIAVLMPAKLWAADGEPEPYAVLSENNTVLTFYYDDQREARGGTLISQDGYPTWGSYEQVVESVVFDLAFANCTSITSTVNWFFNFANLKSITGLQYLNTANVTDMNSMFAGCSSLTSLDLSNFNTSNVTNMFGLFRNCSGLTSLDLSNFNTENVTDMSAMFLSCSNLSSLNIRSFNTSKVGNMESMFYACSSLTNLDLSHFNTANVGDMKQMFQGCTGLTSLNVSNFNTEKVGNMYFMFEGCSNLQELDLGSFITTNVSDMTNMFAGCSSLTSLNVSSFSTPSLIDMTEIFSGCSRLTSLDVRGFNTQNVTSLYGIFSSCSSLTSLDVSNFNTQNVTNMSGVFSDCSGLTSLDVRNFNTEKVVGMGSMFSGCSGLTSLDVSNFKTDNVANMIGMFAGCSSLTSLDVSAFNTENLTNMYEMFRGCSNMSSLDLSDFKTDKVTHMTNMFDGCSNLKTIYAGSGWSTVNVSYGTNVFRDCTSLVGGAGTTYDVSHTDYTYAHIDGGTANPGYFTDKNATPAGNAEPYAVLSDDNTVLTFYYDDQKESRNGMSVGPFDLPQSRGWYEAKDFITSVVFDDSFANCRTITSTAYWFDQCFNLISISGLQFLNTSNVTDMDGMFWECSSLSALDLSNFNTSNVTNMNFMFASCTALTTLDVSNFDVSNVMYMNSMFQNCSGLTTLDLSHFETSNVSVMPGMFADCSSLTSLDLSSFNTANVRNMESMFNRCSALTTIYVGADWTTAAVTETSNNMFYGCTNLVGGQGTAFDANHTDHTYAHIDGGTANPGYFTDKNATPAVVEPYAVLSDDNTVLTFYYDDQKAARNGMSVGPFTNEAARGWNDYMQSITTVTFDDTFANCTSITSTEKWCSGCLNLTTINGLINLNTENVTTMNSMFADCRKLTNLDLSHFKTSNVTSMWAMFNNCLSLTELDMSNFNTENVNDTYAMFAGCSALTTIYVGSEWNTSKMSADYSRNMFADCLKLVGGAGTVFDANHVDYTYAHIDGGTANPGYFTDKNATPAVVEPYAVLSDNNTVLTFYYDDQKATRNGMGVGPFEKEADRGWSGVLGINQVVFDESFANCTSITSTEKWFLDLSALTSITGLSNLKTDHVTSMRAMFCRCTQLKSIDVSTFNTSNVTNMGEMFAYTGLESLDLSKFNTSNVTDMYLMFIGSINLTSIDLSSFNTEKVTNMNSMFMNSLVLQSVDVSSFTTSNVTDMDNMFYNCPALKTIYAGSGWVTKSVTAGDQMFNYSTSLVGGAGTVYDANHTDYTYAHIDGGTANPGYFTDKNATPAVVEPYAVLSENNTVLTFYYDDQMTARNGMSVASSIGDAPSQPWSNHVNSITSVVFDASFANCTTLASTAYWFLDCRQLTTISGISNLNTANVTNMTLMFSDCSSLTSLDVSHFNTANVTEMSAMFQSCSGLTSLDLNNFNTANVTYMSGLFFDCSGLTNLDMSNFNTEKVVDMNRMFIGCSSLAAIQAGSSAIPDSIYAQIENPNLLVYVNNASLAPSSVQNVVINGQAREIVLTDVTSGNNNFYVPQAFTAERISYTRNFAQSTQVGVSRGWESIALPFDVQTITHETKGTIAPFGNTASNRHFWLRELGSNGLQSATGIAANTPYVISMPNSSDYTDNNNLAGRVTFAAENATIPVTEVKASAMADESIVMMPTMQRQERSSEVWALNVGEVRGRYLEGSVFERDYREVRPFEAYTVHREENSQPAPRYVPLQEIGGTTGINVMEDVRSKKDDVWYTTDGRKLQGKPSEKGVYINNGQKIVIR